MPADCQEKLVDARWLEPPEPLERVLTALDGLLPGERLRFLIHIEPHPLYAILARNGFLHETEIEDDGTVAILIWHKQDRAV